MAMDTNVRGTSGLQAEVKPASTAPAAADQALVVAVSPNTPTVPVSVSAAVTVSQGTAANLNATVTTTQLPTALGAKTTANSTAVNIAADQTVPVSGTFFQATQPVSGTFWQTTQPVSAASLPLPSAAATSANQATEITSLASLVANTPVLGQAAMAASVPVVLASNQTSVPVLLYFTDPSSGAQPLAPGTAFQGAWVDMRETNNYLRLILSALNNLAVVSGALPVGDDQSWKG